MISAGQIGGPPRPIS